jgi:Transposase DDE domain
LKRLIMSSKVLRTKSQVRDITQTERTVISLFADLLLADKGYDERGIVERCEMSGVASVIRPKSSHKAQSDCDCALCAGRNVMREN